MTVLKYSILGFKALAHLHILHRSYPLALRWQLLDRCNNRCKYCNLWRNPRTEMSLKDIQQVLTEAKKAGKVRISYSGGEPLLRPDIEEIIKFTKRLGISCSMNTKGALIEKRKETVKSLDLVKISIDGEENTHDFITGRKGSYNQALIALEKCREWGIKTVITATITSHNINTLKHILELAKRLNIMAAFQPFKLMYKGSQDTSLIPPKTEYRQAVQQLIDLKKGKFPYLRNSLSSLYHILEYPEFPNTPCVDGKLFSVIDVDGKMLPCDRNDGPLLGDPQDVRNGYLKAFRSLPKVECSGCGFLGARELSYFANFSYKGLSAVTKLLAR